MNKETIKRNARLIGMICSAILAIIGAFGVEVPSIQECTPLAIAVSIAVAVAEVCDHWFNNNYSEGAKIVQPQIKEINTALKTEMNGMGKGDENE